MGVVYVDGSYNKANNKCGYGVVLTNGDEVIFTKFEECKGEGVRMRNVYGEIMGVMNAISEVIHLGYKQITIAYDYEGIEKWATGEWQRKNEFTKTYYKFIQNANHIIEIKYLKIKSHSNDKFNDMADQLAKRSVGL